MRQHLFDYENIVLNEAICSCGGAFLFTSFSLYHIVLILSIGVKKLKYNIYAKRAIGVIRQLF